MSKVGTILRVSAFILLITGITLIALQRTRPTLRPFSNDVFRCRQLIVSRELKPCLHYLIHGHRGAPLLLRVNGTQKYDRNSEVLDECCQRFQNVTRECRCDAIKEMLHGKQGKGLSRCEASCEGLGTSVNLIAATSGTTRELRR